MNRWIPLLGTYATLFVAMFGIGTIIIEAQPKAIWSDIQAVAEWTDSNSLKFAGMLQDVLTQEQIDTLEVLMFTASNNAKRATVDLAIKELHKVGVEVPELETMKESIPVEAEAEVGIEDIR